MPTQDSIVNQMRQALQVAEPDLDTSIGSPIRSILDTVSEVIAEQTADQYLMSYQYDIDSKSGADLDTFVNLFGMSRYLAKSAVAYVTFSLSASTGQVQTFGAGSQVATGTTPQIVFTTVVPASISATGTSVTIPCTCSISGTVGNVAANTITSAVSPFGTVSSITNTSAATGGVDAETDDALRARFKSTVFRNLAGTDAMYQGVGLDDASVTQANVIGSTKSYFDQVQLSGGIGVSSVQDLAYYYPNTQFLGTNLSGGVNPVFISRGQYGVSSLYQPTPPAPSLTLVSGGSLAYPQAYQYAVVYNITPTISTTASSLSGSTLNLTPTATTTGLAAAGSGVLTHLGTKYFFTYTGVGTTSLTGITWTGGTPSVSSGDLVKITIGTTLSTGLGIAATSPATTSSNRSTTVSWSAGGLPSSTSNAFFASADVYRYNPSTPTVPFEKVNSTPVTSNSYTDTGTAGISTPPLNNTTGAPVIYVPPNPVSQSLTNISVSAGVITVTPTTMWADIAPGQSVTISGTTNYNTTATILSVNQTAGTFTMQSGWTQAAAETSGTITYNAIPDAVYQLQFDYMPVASRNDPANGITNRVDIYVNGDRPLEVTENLVFNQSAVTFNSTDGITVEAINSTTPSMNHQLFQRLDGTSPLVGNLFIPLSYSPIDSLASGIQSMGSVAVTAPLSGSIGTNGSGGSTATEYPFNKIYSYGTDYWVVNEVDQFGRSSKSRAGLEWNIASAQPLHMPQTGDVVTADYNYNQVPTTVQHDMDLWNVVTSDVMVHEANTLYLDFYLAVVLGGNASAGNVFTQIQSVLSNYLSQVGFDGIVQRSAIISTIQQVSGVIAVRFITSAASDSKAILYGTGPLNGVAVGTGTNAHYGIQQINPVTGNVVEIFTASDGSVYRATDIRLDDTELVTLNNVYIAQMSQSMFGSV